MKRYQKIVSLDFEMFNTRYYYSICWAGRADADARLNAVTKRSILVDPTVKKQFTGKDITFPFTPAELKSAGTFDKHFAEILGGLDKDTLVVGHAILNDVKMIVDVCHKYALPVPEFDFLDTNICYSALNGEFREQSLTSLAAQFGYEFEAHDPLEDALATLKALKRMLEKGECADVEAFLSKYDVTPGRVRGGLARRCFYGGMDGKRRLHISCNNLFFDVVTNFSDRLSPEAPFRNKVYYFDNAITSEQNIGFIVRRLLEKGGQIGYDPYVSDVTVTCSILYEERTVLLKDLCFALGFTYADLKGVRLYPRKVCAPDGTPMPYLRYLSEKYDRLRKKDGPLSGETLAFSKSVEEENEFEDLFRHAAELGARVAARVEAADRFVVRAPEDLQTQCFDVRIRTFNRSPRRLMTADELLALGKSQTLNE